LRESGGGCHESHLRPAAMQPFHPVSGPFKAVFVWPAGGEPATFRLSDRCSILLAKALSGVSMPVTEHDHSNAYQERSRCRPRAKVVTKIQTNKKPRRVYASGALITQREYKVMPEDRRARADCRQSANTQRRRARSAIRSWFCV